MPKVRTYHCSRCSYKSKDKTKVEKHIKLHNVLSAQKSDPEECSQTSLGSSQKSVSQSFKSDHDPTGVSHASEVEHEKSVNSDVEEALTEPESESQSEFEELSDSQKKSLSKFESQIEPSTKRLSSQSGSLAKTFQNRYHNIKYDIHVTKTYLESRLSNNKQQDRIYLHVVVYVPRFNSSRKLLPVLLTLPLFYLQG